MNMSARFYWSKVAELKGYWRVSMAALIRRAHDLGRISDSYYRGLMTQLRRAGWRTVEPVALPDGEPAIMRNVVNVHLTTHGYTVSHLSKIALLNEEEFVDRFMPKTTERAPQPHLRR